VSNFLLYLHHTNQIISTEVQSVAGAICVSAVGSASYYSALAAATPIPSATAGGSTATTTSPHTQASTRTESVAAASSTGAAYGFEPVAPKALGIVGLVLGMVF
jgi:hypothetical protein